MEGSGIWKIYTGGQDVSFFVVVFCCFFVFVFCVCVFFFVINMVCYGKTCEPLMCILKFLGMICTTEIFRHSWQETVKAAFVQCMATDTK